MDTSKPNINIKIHEYIYIYIIIESNSKTKAQNLWKKFDKQQFYQVKLLLLYVINIINLY